MLARFKKYICYILIVTLVVSSIPTQVYAEEIESGVDDISQEEIIDTEPEPEQIVEAEEAGSLEETSRDPSEEADGIGSEESSVAETEESSVAETEESSVAETEESSVAEAEESSVVEPEESGVIAPGESSVTEAEESSVADTEESGAADSEESSASGLEESDEAISEEEEASLERAFYSASTFALGTESGYKEWEWLETYHDSLFSGGSSDILQNNQIIITSNQELIMLSYVNPSSYWDKEIIINQSGNNDPFLCGSGYFKLTEDAVVTYENENYFFQGLCGSPDAPFKGKLTISGLSLMSNIPLFIYLSDDATFSQAVSFTPVVNTIDPLLAETVVQGTNTEVTTWEVSLNTSDKNAVGSVCYIGGLIGTIGENASASVNLQNLATASTNVPAIEFASDEFAGMIAGKMETGSALKVSYSETQPTIIHGNVSGFNDNGTLQTNAASDSNVGAFVGSMAQNSALTINGELSYRGRVLAEKGNAGGLVGQMASGSSISFANSPVITTSVSGEPTIQAKIGSAGGIAGYVDCASVSLTDGQTITVQNATISGFGHVGGIYGYYATKTGITVDTTYMVDNVTLGNISGGGDAGGLFGVLRNVKTEGMATGAQINITNPSVKTSYSGGGGNYGGLIGCYKADDLSAVLKIHTVASEQISATLSGQANTFGGVVGKVANQIDGDSSGYSYIEVDAVTVNLSGNQGVSTGHGGIIGEATAGHLLNIGTVEVVDNNASSNFGGVIGRMGNSSVLRLHGTTNLSGVKNVSEGSTSGQIVGSRDKSIIYAVGAGNDENTWKLVRIPQSDPNQKKRISDVGSYGEVLRLDGTKLKEKKLQGEDSLSDDFEAGEILQFHPVTHEIRLCLPSADSISSPRDFTALACYIQQEGNHGGCLSYQINDVKLTIGDNKISGSIILTADIDMSGTGIMGLMRSNDSQTSFWGTFDGNNHTLTLKAGELYGFTSESDGSKDLSTVTESEVENAIKEQLYVGGGQIYNQTYLGMFSQLGDCTIQNLVIDGYIHFDVVGDKMYASVLAGEAKKGNNTEDIRTIVISDVISKSSIVYGGSGWTSEIYVSGFLGKVQGFSNISFSNCTWSGCIKNYKCGGDTAQSTLNAGFVSFIERNEWHNAGDAVTLKLSNCEAFQCSIEDTSSVQLARAGVLLGQTTQIPDKYKYNSFKIEGFTLNNVSITTNATQKSGGLLAYGIYSTEMDISGLTVNNSKLKCQTQAVFGGLVNTATGYWRVHKSETPSYEYGIKFTGTNCFSGKSESGLANTSGLLVASGVDTSKNLALYLEIEADSYVIDEGAAIVDVTSDYFDELVGNTFRTDKVGQNGIVSIATSDGKKLNENEVSAYKRRAYIKTGESEGVFTGKAHQYQNPNTRYYYNLDKLRKETVDAVESVRNISDGIASGEDLLCYSVVCHAADNLCQYFNLNGGAPSNTILYDSQQKSATLDMTGLSFYPLEKNCTLNFGDLNSTIIKFGFGEIYEKNKNDSDANLISLKDSNGQHYQMQYGLFQDFNAVSSSLSIAINKLTLQGNVGYDDSYCGALVCGNITGTYNSNDSSIYNVKMNLNEIELDGIQLYGYDASSEGSYPLLIHTVTEYTDLTLEGVSANAHSDYSNGDEKKKVAASLLGKIGNDTARNVNLTFSKMALDGRTGQSIFSKALFIYSFLYASGSGQYNFTTTDKVNEEVTYGQEISNTEGGTVSGRNNGLQYQYYDGGEVQNPWGTNTDSMDVRFATGFLPYVYWGEEKDNAGNTYKNSHEIDVNLKILFLEHGCGTYSDPYLIEDGMQLERLASYINDGLKLSGMKVQVSVDILNNLRGTKTKHSCSKNEDGITYTYTDSNNEITQHATYCVNGNEWTFFEGNEQSISDLQTKIRDYLRNAYYLITNDITLGNSGSYYGIGNASVSGIIQEGRTFCGVIVGKKKQDNSYPVITMTAPKISRTTFAGLVSCANGCVIKDLVIDYTAASIQITGATSHQTNNLGNVSFFGGVIGRVFGGDNIIDNVEVRYDNTSVIVSDTTNNYAYLAAVGGYVGMIGWDYQGGGGVIFRNIPQNTTQNTQQASFLSEMKVGDTTVSLTTEYSTGNRYFYANPYVGRVTDAYVCYEKTNDGNVCADLNNTNKNYMIPKLVTTDKLSVGSWSSSVATPIQVTIGSSQQMWIMSAIVNSGAGAMNCPSDSRYYYGKNASITNADNSKNGDLAYNAGKVRYGNYNTVGTIVSEEPTEEQWWGGIYSNSAQKVSYLVKNYTSDVNLTYPAAHLCGNNARVAISVTADCDMSGYGNGFRGIGSSYNRYGVRGADYRRIVLQDFNGGDCTITLKMENHEYYEEANDGNSDNTLRCCSSALFPFVRLLTETNDKGLEKANPREFKNMILKGKVTKDFFQTQIEQEVNVPSSKEEIFTAGFIGSVCNTGAKKASYISALNLNLINITISGGYDTGGIIAYFNASAARNIQFLSCKITNNSNMTGAVCCGGYVGAFNQGGSNSIVSVNRDFDGNRTDKEILISDSKFICQAKKNDSCEGGFVGYSNGKCFFANGIISICSFEAEKGSATHIGGCVGIKAEGNLNIEAISQIGNTYKGNTNNNLGGFVGYIYKAAQFGIADCSLLENIKDTVTSPVTFSTAQSIGGVVGKMDATGNTQMIQNCVVGGENPHSVTMEKASNIGGLVGHMTSSSQVTVQDCTVKNISVASSGNIGGVCGYVGNGNPLFTEVTVSDIRLLGSDCVGGVVGKGEGQSTKINVSNIILKDSWIVLAKEDRYNRNQIGAGVLLGASNTETSVNGYNILSKNNCLGYQIQDVDNSDWQQQTYQKLVISDTITFKKINETVNLENVKSLSTSNVGLRDNGPYTYENGAIKETYKNETVNDFVVSIPLSKLQTTGVSDATSDLPFRFAKGNIGNWIGCILNGSEAKNIKLVGIRKEGSYLSNFDIGYSSGAGMLIYNDYEGVSAKQTAETNSGKAPFITTSPASDALINMHTDQTGAETISLTGDGVCFAEDTTKSVLYQIMQDYSQNAGRQWNQVYGGVDVGIYQDFGATGKYAESLTEYQVAESYVTTKAGCNFPIMVVESLDATEITEMVNHYVSVATNTTQTKDSHTYADVEITTYRWDTDHFSCYETNAAGDRQKIPTSLVWDGTRQLVKAVVGKYDNSRSQFTLVDVQFPSPVENDTTVFHVYIPILVKKVMDFKMYIAAKNGTDYSIAGYEGLHSTVLASHGEYVTLRLTYQYFRTKEEWENSINGGENYLWRYDKAISFGNPLSTSLPDGTWLALVDTQSGGMMYEAILGEQNKLSGNILKFSTVFPNWAADEREDLYFSSILPLEATENADTGEMVETDKANGTVYVQGKYYKPYVADPEAETQPVRYHITCAENATEGEYNGYVPVMESYFLTIHTPKDATDLISVNTDFVSIYGGMPTRKVNNGVTKPQGNSGNRGTENNLVIGNFFGQSSVTVTTYSDTEDKLSDEVPSFKGEMVAKVDFSGATEEEKQKNKNLFNQNSAAVTNLWQQFALRMQEYKADKSQSSFLIPVGTRVECKSIQISYVDGNGTTQNCTLESSEYIKGYSVNGQYKLTFEMIDILSYLKASNGGVTVKMDFMVTFSEEGLEALPRRANEQSVAGVSAKGSSKIAYEKTSIATAGAMEGEGKNHYWSAKDESASMEYYASEMDDGSSTGYTSQLGINALEDGTATILSNGYYNLAAVNNLQEVNAIHYTLRLYRKTDEGSYGEVDLREYLSDITIQGKSLETSYETMGSSASNAYNTLVYNSDRKCAELYMDWSAETVGQEAVWSIPVTFDVTTGWSGEDTGYYSNYKVVLSAELGTLSQDKSLMTVKDGTRAEDYIIYTNAKIHVGIVPVYQ